MTQPMYAITWHKPERLLRLTWLEGTAGMADEDFRATLEVFADGAIHHRAIRLLIDVRQFKHRPSKEILAWRDQVITCLAMSPDGKTLAVVGSDPTIRLWDVATRKERRRLEGHLGQVTSLSWSSDSETLASGSADGTALVWDLRK